MIPGAPLRRWHSWASLLRTHASAGPPQTPLPQLRRNGISRRGCLRAVQGSERLNALGDSFGPSRGHDAVSLRDGTTALHVALMMEHNPQAAPMHLTVHALCGM